MEQHGHRSSTTTLEQHLHGQIADEAGRFWHRLRWRAWSNRVAMREPIEILDVGAGAGLLGEIVAAERPLARYNFIEPIPSMAAALEKRWGVDRNAARSDDLRCFDIVAALDVVEHVEDDVGFVSDLLDRMAPGAVLVVTVPALQRLWSPWDEALGHHRRYSRRSIRHVVDSERVRVEEVSFLFPELLLPSLVNARRKGAARAEWPRIPRLVDNLLYYGGIPSVALRRWWPIGTSLLAVVTRI